MNKLTLIIFSLPFLSACSPSIPDFPKLSIPTLYKADTHQGSVLNRFQVNQLKLGMSKTQVRDLIGSPSVIDPFHNNQWDYINHSTLHKKADIRYRLTLKFKGDILVDIDTSGIASLPLLSDNKKTLEDEGKKTTQ